MQVTVKQKFNRTAPRKLRLLADLVRGYKAENALNQLRFIPKAAATDLSKILQSGIAAAKESNLDLENTYISELKIDEGPALKRRVYMARGRATTIRKQMSHITLTLSEKEIIKPEETKTNTEIEPVEKKDSTDSKESQNGS